MKITQYIATTGILACLVGSVTAQRIAVQEPVGPCNRVESANTTDGSLVVYSARRKADVDIRGQEFAWNNDFGKNEFMYELAHSDYDICRSDGTVIKRVRNARGKNDAAPTSVSLPTGLYTIQAEAEMQGVTIMKVRVPVVIEAGQTTALHLEPTWERPSAPAEMGNVVKLADGRVIGCRAPQMPGQQSLGLKSH